MGNSCFIYLWSIFVFVSVTRESELAVDKYEGLLEKKYVSHDADARKKAILEEMAEKAARVKQMMSNPKNNAKIEVRTPSGEVRIKSNKSKEILEDDFSDDDLAPPPPSDDLNEKPKTDYSYLLERRRAEEAKREKEEKKLKKYKHKEKHKDREKYKDHEKSNKYDHNLDVEGKEKREKKEKKEKKPKIVRRVNQGKAVLSFEDLLKMAQNPKPEADTKTVTKNPIKPPKTGRPMTAEEKAREERKRSKEYQQWYKYGGTRPSAPATHTMSDSDDESDEEGPPARDRHFTDIKPNGIGKPAMTLEQKKALMMRVNSALQSRPKPSGASSGTSSHRSAMPEADQSRKKLQLPGRPSDDPFKRPDSGLKAPIRPSHMTPPGRPVPKIASKPASFATQAAIMESREERESILVCGPSRPSSSSSTSSSYKSEHKRDKHPQRPDKPERPSSHEPEERMSAWDRIYSQVRKPKPKPGQW